MGRLKALSVEDMAVLPDVRAFFEPVKRFENQLIVVVEQLVVDVDECKEDVGSLSLVSPDGFGVGARQKQMAHRRRAFCELTGAGAPIADDDEQTRIADGGRPDAALRTTTRTVCALWRRAAATSTGSSRWRLSTTLWPQPMPPLH